MTLFFNLAAEKMETCVIASFLLGFLAPVQSLSLVPEVPPNSTIPSNLGFMINIYTRVAMICGVILFFIIGGISVTIYWHCCRGQETALAELRRRNANRIAAANNGSNTATGPPAYDDVTADLPPTYSEPIPNEDKDSKSDCPPPYTSPAPGSKFETTTHVPVDDPPVYSDPSNKSRDLPSSV